MTPLASALPGYAPGPWVSSMPGGHGTQDAPGTAALDGEMIMASETMINERPIRILPVFISSSILVVLAWVGDTPICLLVHHLIVMSCAGVDKYPKSQGFECLTPGFNEGTAQMGSYINRHAFIFR
jgi:hypothetical protein